MNIHRVHLHGTARSQVGLENVSQHLGSADVDHQRLIPADQVGVGVDRLEAAHRVCVELESEVEI